MQHIAPNVRTIALYFNVPIGIALERNKQRTGWALVPENVIYRMNSQLIKPTRKEGFYEVWYINEDGQIYGKEF
jgi:predicted kinase